MKTWMKTCVVIGVLVSSPSLPQAAEPLLEKDPVEMVNIPAGPFIRGSTETQGRPDERPRKKIFLNAFAMDKYEVSNRQYQKFVEETLHKPPFNVYGDGDVFNVPGIANHPVVQVTWHDAVDYCFWAGKRLPTEAEWEKAARGKDGQMYPWGDTGDSGKLANFDGEWHGKDTLMDVTTMPEGASPYGLHHMAGNVREWVEDWYDSDYYNLSPNRNPRGPDAGILKVIRGGSWRSFLPDLRTASRGKGGFALKTHGIGFRCARDINAIKKTKTRTSNGK
ncbi:MAG: hypothetical protein NPIRA02_39510 [Nitrospirales bacterium]|nr:MAG: hypothetical protein NPIRA02_39510 [Nitrospirales bacterium]